jgi:hypothetical protein
MPSKGVGGHQRAYQGKTDEWLTPPEITAELGPFDLDPCSPVVRPWATATTHLTIEDDGLVQPWAGRVWLNPPYGPQTGVWLKKLAEHGDGIALVFARTETEMFHAYAWQRADAMLFLKGRLHFHDVTGKRAKFNSGAPSVLLAYGEYNASRLRNCSIPGHYVSLSRALSSVA